MSASSSIRRVLLTGGSGFLGSHIATELHRRGIEVRALVREKAGFPSINGSHAGSALAGPGDLGTTSARAAQLAQQAAQQTTQQRAQQAAQQTTEQAPQRPKAQTKETSPAVRLRQSAIDALHEAQADIVSADMRDTSAVRAALQGCDAVVHAAGIVKALRPATFFQINGEGTKTLVALAQSVPSVQRFTYVSSLAAHGFPDSAHPRNEDEIPRPVTYYGESKLVGERHVDAAKDDLHVSTIRPPAIYGPRDAEMLVFFQAIARRIAPFMGRADNLLSLIYVEDCASAVCDALLGPQASGRTYAIEDGTVYSQADFRRHAEHALGVRALPIPVPIPLLRAVASVSELYGSLSKQAVMLTRNKVEELRQRYIICSSARIHEELGWTPKTSFGQGAKLTVDWYRAHGLL